MTIILIALAILVSTLHVPAAANSIPVAENFAYITGAAEKGAFCLDGSLPAYNFVHGHGSGSNSWIVILDGGGWCTNSTDPQDGNSCVHRKITEVGSSIHMTKYREFSGMTSTNAQINPYFFNYNMRLIRYCDGASYAGDGEDKENGLYFRGQRIYQAAIDEFMSQGMRHADQVIFLGGSAGGVGVVLHCNHFSSLFPKTTRVKCVSDAGLFMDIVDISGKRRMRNFVESVVTQQGVEKMLPHSCTSRLGPILCFFPHYLINYVKAPLFLVNAAYDIWQVEASIASNLADPLDKWHICKRNFTCSASQHHKIEGLRKAMLKATKAFLKNKANGAFINACFTHSQLEYATWSSPSGPKINNKGIARSLMDWYFNDTHVKEIGPPFPHDKTCINSSFNETFQY